MPPLTDVFPTSGWYDPPFPESKFRSACWMLLWSAPTAATTIYSMADAELDESRLADDTVDAVVIELCLDILVLSWDSVLDSSSFVAVSFSGFPVFSPSSEPSTSWGYGGSGTGSILRTVPPGYPGGPVSSVSQSSWSMRTNKSRPTSTTPHGMLQSAGPPTQPMPLPVFHGRFFGTSMCPWAPISHHPMQNSESALLLQAKNPAFETGLRSQVILLLRVECLVTQALVANWEDYSEKYGPPCVVVCPFITSTKLVEILMGWALLYPESVSGTYCTTVPLWVSTCSPCGRSESLE